MESHPPMICQGRLAWMDQTRERTICRLAAEGQAGTGRSCSMAVYKMRCSCCVENFIMCANCAHQKHASGEAGFPLHAGLLLHASCLFWCVLGFLHSCCISTISGRWVPLASVRSLSNTVPLEFFCIVHALVVVASHKAACLPSMTPHALWVPLQRVMSCCTTELCPPPLAPLWRPALVCMCHRMPT